MFFGRIFALVCFTALTASTGSCDDKEGSPWTRWSLKPGVEALFFDSAEESSSPAAISLSVSTPLSDSWSMDIVGLIVPYAYDNAADHCGLGFSTEFLYHLTRFARLDPYLAVGAGYYHGADTIAGPRAGAGVQYHLTEQLALRLDTRAMMSAEDGDMFYSAGVGLSYRFGADPQADAKTMQLPDGRRDSDGDGLSDDDESMKGTDPFNKDSDKDGLSDLEECRTTLTDPLNPDSDFDGLTDGEEVRKWKTAPLKRDTDGGGVDDGHELFIDKTDPLNLSDDLFLVVIPASFEYTLTPFKSDVLDGLDRLAALLVSNPQATVRIEAHTDRKIRADEKAACSLTERYAKLAGEHLTSKGVASSRLSMIGLGFSRSKVQANLVRGNPENRRLEIYVRGLPRATALPPERKGNP